MFGFLFKLPPQKAEYILRKANRLYEMQKFNKAIPLYKKILKSDASHFAAKANLAVCYFECGNFQKAIPLLQEVSAMDSGNPWWQNYLSQSYQKTGQYALALDCAWQAVKISGGANEHHLNMAYTVYETADEKGAEFVDSFLQKWYRQYPHSGIVSQSYKSFHFDNNFTQSDIEYVENLFDVFAPDFDSVLSDLEYNSPSEIAQVLADFFYGKNVENPNILDIGCGSGLCGKHIAENIPQAVLCGVDISAKMLAEAAKKNVYKQLVKCNITDCFESIKTHFDAVVASDVLTYFGELKIIFSLVAEILKKNGAFAFTISLNEANDKDWFLCSCSRFSHSEKYVKKILNDCGFAIIKNEYKILRKEGEKDVVGRLFLAVKK